MKNILFNPWIGENYGKTELGRLLIIGDSHYFLNNEDESVFPNFTIDIVANLQDTNFKFFKNLGKVFNPSNDLDLWSKIAFANAIQVDFRSSDQKPTYDDYKTVEPAIQEYLNILKPDRIIVFSKRVWEDGLKTNITWGEHVGEIIDEEYNKVSTVWKFNYENGMCLGIGVHHPSYRKFKSEEWRPLIDKFLKETYPKK